MPVDHDGSIGANPVAAIVLRGTGRDSGLRANSTSPGERPVARHAVRSGGYGSAQPHLYIIPRRVLDRLQLAVTRHARRHLLLAKRTDPAVPVGPPGAGNLGGALEPLLGIRRQFRIDPVA